MKKIFISCCLVGSATFSLVALGNPPYYPSYPGQFYNRMPPAPPFKALPGCTELVPNMPIPIHVQGAAVSGDKETLAAGTFSNGSLEQLNDGSDIIDTLKNQLTAVQSIGNSMQYGSVSLAPTARALPSLGQINEVTNRSTLNLVAAPGPVGASLNLNGYFSLTPNEIGAIQMSMDYKAPGTSMIPIQVCGAAVYVSMDDQGNVVKSVIQLELKRQAGDDLFYPVEAESDNSVPAVAPGTSFVGQSQQFLNPNSSGLLFR